MSTTSSRNFTTLYSGSGSVVPQGAYGNANVVSLLAAGTDGGNTVAGIVATGNISTTANMSAQGNVTAAYFIGNGSLLTNINAGNITGNVNFANTAGTAQFVTGNAQANITSVGTLTSLSVSGNTVGGNLITAGAVSAASVSASGNITGGNLLSPGSITATGNVTAANFFGNVFGNIVGNVDAAGSDTQIQFNTGNLLDASANLTFDKSTSTIKVTGNSGFPTSGIEITANTITGNTALGNLVITNRFGVGYGPVVIDTNYLTVGQDNAAFNTNAVVSAIRNQALQLTTTNAGAPSIYVGKYVANTTLTGNVDVQSSNVGGYGGTGNINLSGNVYVGRNAQGADTANAKANLIVTDSVYINQNLSVAGNISIPNLSTTGNITAGNFITAGNLYGNVVASSISGQGTANLDIIQSGNSLGATTLNLAANIVVAGGSASSVITSAPGSNLQLTTNQGGSSGQPRVFVDQYDPGVQAGNVDVRTGGGAISGGFAANATVNISGNVRIGPYAPGVAPASTGINLEVAGAVSATGNITTGNLLTGGVVSATGNITGANINSAVFQAVNSAGGALRNASGSNQLQWGGGGGNNLTVDVAINISPANAVVTVSPTGTGYVTMAPTTTGSINNMVIGNVTPAAVTATTISASGNVDAGNLRTAGAVSATGNITGGNVIVPINGKYYGDFTTGTTAGRTVFQTTATGTSAATSLTAVPGPNHITSNTAFSSQINLFASGADLGNSAFGRMQMFGNRLNFEATAAGTGPVGNMRFAAGSAQIVLLNTGNCGIGNANPNHALSTNEGYFQGNISVTGNVITNKFLQAQSYTAAALNAITGSIGQMAAVSDSAGGGNPNGMLAFWDTTNARWSYIHDNTAV